MSAASVVAELAEIDALPGAKVEPSVGDRDIDARARDYALGMCGHVIRAFKNMSIVRHILRYEPVVNSFHVVPHVWIPVLTYA